MAEVVTSLPLGLASEIISLDLVPVDTTVFFVLFKNPSQSLSFTATPPL